MFDLQVRLVVFSLEWLLILEMTGLLNTMRSIIYSYLKENQDKCFQYIITTLILIAV